MDLLYTNQEIGKAEIETYIDDGWILEDEFQEFFFFLYTFNVFWSASLLA